MELQDALTQIGDIRLQMSRTRQFHGYGAATTFCTSLAAVAAAIWQMRYLPHAEADPVSFVNLWTGVATVCVLLVALELILRYRDSDSSLQRELTILAVVQFLPSIVIGGLITLVLREVAGSSLWMLPGLWQAFFASGLFASRRVLPPPIIFVAMFYVAAGLVNLAIAGNGMGFSPWAMAVPFAVGQAATAVILSRKASLNYAD
jgi:hypothetical protein